MADEELLEYDLQFAEKPFKVKMKDAEKKAITERWYVMVELSGAERDKYLQGTINRAKTDGEGKVTGVRDMTGYQAALLCLGVRDWLPLGGAENQFPKVGKPGEAPLDPGMFQAWPARVQDDIFNRIQKMSALNQDDKKKNKPEDDAKKS